MNLLINIKNRENVTKESIRQFLVDLKEKGFFGSPQIDYIYTSNTNEPDAKNVSAEEAMQHIDKNGVDRLSISFSYKNHYKHEGRPKDMGHFAGIMYSLNIASGEMAEALGSDSSIDFYFSVLFHNRVVESEYGEIEECGMQFGGEGGYTEDVEKGVSIITNVMETEYPAFGKLVASMNEIFGDTDIILEYEEF